MKVNLITSTPRSLSTLKSEHIKQDITINKVLQVKLQNIKYMRTTHISHLMLP